MMKNTSLESYLVIENIDRKNGEFQSQANYQSTLNDIYSDPEVIIIKNDMGRIVFNELVKLFDYKEKGAKPLEQGIAYPYYVFTCDWITSGCRFGLWHYFQDVDSLADEVDINSMTDNFDEFREDLIRIFTANGL